jgi:DNA-binding NtrC family response regulator
MNADDSRTVSFNPVPRRARGFAGRRELAPCALEPERAPRAPVILVVEDDEAFRELVASHFREHGYRVLECSDGRELVRCIEAYRERGARPRFDLAICDVHLPGPWSGLDLLERMNREGPRIPIILISGFGDIHTCVAAANKRAAAFFPKPVELQRLLSTARALLWKIP